jgi:hypothetical protein
LQLDEFPNEYVGGKRKRYQRAVDSLNEKPLSLEDSVVKTFVKADKFDLVAKPDPIPRAIQPRDPRYGAALGRFIRPMEKPIYHAINKLFGGTTVFKGLNADKRGVALREAWEAVNDPVAIGIDASKFDAHVRRSMLMLEHMVYKAFCPKEDLGELTKLLKMQLRTIGKGYCNDGKVTYRFDGRRCSGDMNTACGNVIIMCLCVHSYLDQIGAQYRFVDDGDDGVIIIGRKDLHLLGNFPSYMDSLGFPMTMEDPVYELELIEFCQSQPVFVNGEYRMVRQPKTAMAKDIYTCKPCSDEHSWNRFRTLMAYSGLTLSMGVPVMGNFYQYLMRGAPSLKRRRNTQFTTGMQWLAVGMQQYEGEHSLPEISIASRVSFYRAFGVTPKQQMQVERFYDSQTPSYNPTYSQLNIYYNQFKNKNNNTISHIIW